MCIQLLLVSGLSSAFGFPFLSPREFSGSTPHSPPDPLGQFEKWEVKLGEGNDFWFQVSGGLLKDSKNRGLTVVRYSGDSK